MHSNGEEGGGFSFGGDSMEYGWQICKIDDWSTSKCGEGKKVKNGAYVHLRSVSGSQAGNVLHSNMEEGAMLSYGGDDAGELGWRLIAVDEDAGKIRYGMDVMLQGMGTGTFMHSNAVEGGAFSGGGESPEHGFVIEGGEEGDKVRYGQTITLKCIADAHDGSGRGPYMHSNGEEGGGFSFGGDSMEYGWQICKIDDWSTSKCGEGKKVKNGAYVHLRSVSGSCEGNVLHSNMEEGAMLSYGSDEHGELGWRVIAADEDASKIRYGMCVMLQGMGTGTFMHSNSEEGGPFSGGGESPDYGWVIEGGDEGDKVRYGQTIMLKCVADGRDDYMHSNGEEGGGFSFGGAAPEYGWEIAPNHGWSSDSSD